MPNTTGLRSVRAYAPEPLALADLSQLLWAAQGTNRPDGKRTAPSAGALYPLEVYVVAAKVRGLAPGNYKYRTRGHELEELFAGDHRLELAAATYRQDWIAEAPAALVLAAVYARTARKYGERGARYVHMEIGHAAQNVYLQAAGRDLGTVMVGAFDDDAVSRALRMQRQERPLAIMPVGRLE